MLAVALGQWAWTFVPTPSEARSRETADVLDTPPSVSGDVATARVLGVLFTPPTGAGKALVRWIDDARQEVLVQAYGFTHNAIAQALLRAHQRGFGLPCCWTRRVPRPTAM